MIDMIGKMAEPVDTDRLCDDCITDWTNAGVHYYSASAGQVNFRSVQNLGTRSLFAHMVILN